MSRVKLSLPFCLSSMLNPMERHILSDALYLFDRAACACLSASQRMKLSLFNRLPACIFVHFVSLSVCLHTRLSVRWAALCVCLPASMQTRLHRPVCLCMGSLTGIDSLWRRVPLTSHVFPSGDPALCFCVLHAWWVTVEKCVCVCVLEEGARVAITGPVIVWWCVRWAMLGMDPYF